MWLKIAEDLTDKQEARLDPSHITKVILRVEVTRFFFLFYEFYVLSVFFLWRVQHKIHPIIMLRVLVHLDRFGSCLA